MLDSVNVDYYGSQMPLNQIAQVHAPEPQMITVQPFDPSQVGAIEKAIRGAELGLNPMNDGKLIRVPVPALTQERRQEMVKHLHKVLEEHRGRRKAVARGDPETHRRRNQEDGRDEQSQRKGSPGAEVGTFDSCQWEVRASEACGCPLCFRSRPH